MENTIVLKINCTTKRVEVQSNQANAADDIAVLISAAVRIQARELGMTYEESMVALANNMKTASEMMEGNYAKRNEKD